MEDILTVGRWEGVGEWVTRVKGSRSTDRLVVTKQS